MEVEEWAPGCVAGSGCGCCTWFSSACVGRKAVCKMEQDEPVARNRRGEAEGSLEFILSQGVLF